MATIRKRKLKTQISFQVQVRRVGSALITKSFLTKEDAIKWARKTERELDQGAFQDYKESDKVTLGNLFERYIAEGKHKKKRQWRYEEYRKNQLLEDELAKVSLLKLSTKHLAEFRDRRLKEVRAATFNKDFNFISVVIATALQDWGYSLPNNPCKFFKRVSEGNPRDRILESWEETKLINACRQSHNKYLPKIIEFAIETAVRQGELLNIQYDDIDFNNRLLHLPLTKSGYPRTIPLSIKAYTILKELPRRLDRKVFPLTRDALKNLFQRALKKSNIQEFRFHDLRRHSCTKMFEKGLSVPEVQLTSGHRNPKILLSTYTKLDPKKIVAKLG